MWNKAENRKISGNAAPMEKNLHEYLRKHPECEVYTCQDKEYRPMDSLLIGGMIAGMGTTTDDAGGSEKRITIWNKRESRKISGNAAPLEKNLWTYLRDHPEYEVYNGQDKRPGEYKRVWLEGSDKDDVSPTEGQWKGGSVDRNGGEFSFKDQIPFDSATGHNEFGTTSTPWGMQLGGHSTGPELERKSSMGSQGDMMMQPYSLGSMDMPMGSLGSAGSLGSMGSAGSLGLARVAREHSGGQPVPVLGPGSLGSMGSMGLGSLGSSLGSLGSLDGGPAPRRSTQQLFPRHGGAGTAGSGMDVDD